VLALSLGTLTGPVIGAAAAQRSVPVLLTQPVTYRSVAIEVPNSWPVMTRQADVCGTAGPAALYGPRPTPRYGTACPYIRRLAVVVTLGGGDVIVPVGHEHRTTIDGIKAAVSVHHVTGGGTILVARFPGRGVWFSASAPGPSAPPSGGGDIGLVRQILATVHPSAPPRRPLP
jgi:hypothetical protein